MTTIKEYVTNFYFYFFLSFFFLSTLFSVPSSALFCPPHHTLICFWFLDVELLLMLVHASFCVAAASSTSSIPSGLDEIEFNFWLLFVLTETFHRTNYFVAVFALETNFLPF